MEHKGSSVYSLVSHGESGHIKMDAKTIVGDYYQSDGEVIIIQSDMYEYKKYFTKGTEVEWDIYK